MKYLFRFLTLLAIAAAIYCLAGASSDGFFERKTVADAFVNRLPYTWIYIAGVFASLALTAFLSYLGWNKK